MKFDTDFNGRIIQVMDALSYGDAVSNQVVQLDSLFRSLGFNSAVYTKFFDERVEKYRHDLSDLQVDERDILILHFYGHSEYAVPFTLESYCTHILVYHNITPAEYFDSKTDTHDFCARGRAQLLAIISEFDFYWGDSQYNLEEIITLGVDPLRCDVIPIIVPVPSEENQSIRDQGSWLFVGRIAPNKQQDKLIKLFSRLRKNHPGAAQMLYLVGAYSSNDPYYNKILEGIQSLGLKDHIVLTGKLSYEERDAHYRRSTLFVSMSAHEGFGVPLVESPLRGLPVVALNTSAVAETVGCHQALARNEDDLEKLIINAISDPSFRTELLTKESTHAARYAPQPVARQLMSALAKVLPRKNEFRSVSIVICTYNRRLYLERLLDYLSYQTNSNFEIIVVDGPSNDGTKEFLDTWSGRIKIRHNPERNLSKSRNMGIECSSSEIVAFIDDDAIPFDDWVENILRAYNSRPLTTAGLGGPVYYAGSFWFQAKDNAINKFGEAIVNIETDRIGKDGWLRYNTGTNATFRKCALVSINGFDEQYDYFLDESEVCYRLQSNRIGLIGYEPELYLRHEFAQSENRLGRYKYNWFTICKNSAYFAAAYSGLSDDALHKYLIERFNKERITHFDEAVQQGELSAIERDQHVDAVWKGMKQGLEDYKSSFPRTRKLLIMPSSFLPFHAVNTRLRVAHEIKRLHVCIVSKEFPPFAGRGGIGTLYYHLASELLLMGHYVTIITPSDDPHVFEQGRFRVLFCGRQSASFSGLDGGFANNMDWSLSATDAISKLAEYHPVDVVDSALWDTETLSFVLIRREERPALVVRLVTPFPVASEINGWQVPSDTANYFKLAERKLIEKADAVVPISESIIETIENTYSIVRDCRWSKVPCGIAYWPSFDVNDDYTDIQQLSDLPDSVLKCRKIILFVGRLELRKGIDVVLQAANTFLAADDKARLIIAGRDVEDWQHRCQDVVRDDIRNRIHFVGEVTEASREKLLAKAYCLLFPSRYESFGIVPLEAFVHGVPVVAAASGAIPEVVLENCGLLFDIKKPDDLGYQVAKLISDVEMRNRLSLGARKRALDLSSRKSALESINVYHSII